MGSRLDIQCQYHTSDTVDKSLRVPILDPGKNLISWMHCLILCLYSKLHTAWLTVCINFSLPLSLLVKKILPASINNYYDWLFFLPIIIILNHIFAPCMISHIMPWIMLVTVSLGKPLWALSVILNCWLQFQIIKSLLTVNSPSLYLIIMTL